MGKSIFAIILTITMFQSFRLSLVLDQIEKRPYTEDYKCLNFSKDLKRSLERIGIQSEVVIGESPTTLKQPLIKHAWVGIWIEPQTGNFTNNYLK